jgi:uncharacterized protein YneF (UPF0154 family)
MEIGGSPEGAAIIALLFIGYIVYFKYFYWHKHSKKPPHNETAFRCMLRKGTTMS